MCSLLKGRRRVIRCDVVGFDHVVVMTSSLERTCGAIESATGESLRRIREAGPVRQGFHRLGQLIVEVVETHRLTVAHGPVLGLRVVRGGSVRGV